jgi:tRNA threonylcarbamoyladenosine biosynthesis protein TsaB
VAVVRDEVVLVELCGDPGVTHGERLPGDLMRALDRAGVPVTDLDLLAVATGPGSFTGLRVGIASMQGLAFARGLKIVPVSTLEALARVGAAHVERETAVAPWIDAQRGQVFAALYASDASSVLATPSAAAPADTLAAWRSVIADRSVLFAGDGALRYRDLIAARLGPCGRILEPLTPLAGVVASIAAGEPGRAVLPHAVVPTYVRRPDAELARERSASR